MNHSKKGFRYENWKKSFWRY